MLFFMVQVYTIIAMIFLTITNSAFVLEMYDLQRYKHFSWQTFEATIYFVLSLIFSVMTYFTMYFFVFILHR